ncbi:LysR family transcriptional regulator [Sciscionella sediminilitoris]|uniref:LysR family transcriptional regulator n=1 Tax=Sciscionella sediminilitoris TaxID=1445613 RepID=UPI00055BBA69|nr:LysR family transcriptional regulator [Sciscionella sp. SE31]
MELRHLVTFRAVAQGLSFTGAAGRLGYVQSAVTQHVKALEEELGVPLFDRLGRRIALTEAGTRLFDYATRIDRLAEEAADVVRGPGEPEGPVTVIAPETLCAYRLPPLLHRLYHEHPRVRLAFESSPSGALDAGLVRRLAGGELDLALVLEETLEPAAPLAAELFTEEPLSLVTAPDHRLAGNRRVTAADLDGVPMLLTDKGCRFRAALERALAGQPCRPDVVGEFASNETIKRVAAAGGTVGVVAAASVESELASGSLRELAWAGSPLAVRSYLVRNAARWPRPAVEAVLGTFRSVR